MNNLPTLSLTDVEKDHLLFIYRKRVRLFVMAYLVIIPFALLCCFKTDFRDRYSNQVRHWSKKEQGDSLVDLTQMVLINILWLEGPLIVLGARIFYKRIWSFKKDASNGVKECVPYLITMKQYFELTGQYFLSLNDPAYMHHEVDETTYNSCMEGDKMVVYRAPVSKYVFEKNGRFTLM